MAQNNRQETMEGENELEQYIDPSVETAIDTAKTEIQNNLQDPLQDLTDKSLQLGFLAAIGEATKPHAQNIQDILFKDLKASAAAAFALVPLVGEGQAGMIVGSKIKQTKELYDTAKTKGASPLKAAFETGKMMPKMTIESILAIRNTQRSPALGIAKVDKSLEEVNKANKIVKMAEEALIKAENKAKPVMAACDLISESDSAIKAAKTVLEAARANYQIALTTEKLEKAIRDARNTKEALESAERIAGASLTSSQYKVFAEALEDQIPINQALHFALKGFYPGKKSIMAKGLNKGKNIFKHNIGKVMGLFDPTPDVPWAVGKATWGAEMLGLHGAGIVPATWQLVRNKVDYLKEYRDLVKDVGSVVAERTRQKIEALRQPEVAVAAKEFI